eukprot:1880572-Rhodomonas_salina.3
MDGTGVGRSWETMEEGRARGWRVGHVLTGEETQGSGTRFGTRGQRMAVFNVRGCETRTEDGAQRLEDAT